MSKAELDPKTIKTDKLIGKIEDGDIKIPAFQRGFVWTQDKVIKLLDSIYNNYPIGSALLWSTTEKLKATRNVAGFEIPEKPPAYPVNYVLDGQQRLSTIYGVFCTNRKQAATDTTYWVDPAIFDISYDFEKGEFLPTGSVTNPARSVQLQVLFDTDKFFPALESLSPDDRKAAQTLHSKFNNYEFPIVTISGRDKTEVGIIFERINNTGTRLSTLDLMIAWTWSDDFHLHHKIKELLETLDEKGFGDIDERVILQSLSAILRKSTKTRTILNLPPAEVRDNFDALTAALERAVDFLSTDLGIVTRKLLPHVQQVVGLAYFFHAVPTPSQAQAAMLRRWFWNTSFSHRYSAQTDDKMDDDVKLMDQIVEGKVLDWSRYSYTVTPLELVRETLKKASPIARAFLLLLANKVPLDLTNGVKVDVGKALSKFNRKEYHHIFPHAFLKARAVATYKINSLVNFCFLSSASNKKISSKAPSDYFTSIVPEDQRKAICEANILPLKAEIYDKDDYDAFLEQRAQQVLAYLDALVA